MIELIHKRKWDSKVFDTGRTQLNKDGTREDPVYGTKLQNGLHDIEPDGSFVDINTLFQPHTVGVSTNKVTRNRCGEVRASDTGSESKDLAKVKTKNLCGVSLKLKGYRTYGPHFDDLKSTYYTTNDGITLEYYPNYKGVNIVIVIDNPQIASNVYRFSIQEYGCSYTYEKIEGGIKCISSTGKDDIYIKALYVKDANDNYGSVDIDLDGVENGRQIIKKTIAPVWLGNAVGPVESDPSVTIDDDTGTFEDAVIIEHSGLANNNFGANVQAEALQYTSVFRESTLMYVDLTSLSSVSVIDSYFGLDVYQFTAAFDTNMHKVLRAWGEGNKVNAAATAGECAWNYSAFPTGWTTAGCKGDGTDRVATPVGSLQFTTTGSDIHYAISTATVQGWIDTPASNLGVLIEAPNIANGRLAVWRSSEAVTGNKPYIYVEYTEGNYIPFFFDAGHY